MSSSQYVFELGVALRGSKRDDALVGGAVGCTVKRLARLKTHGHSPLARQVDDLLESRTSGASRNQNAVERTRGAQSLAYGMNAGQQTARLA